MEIMILIFVNYRMMYIFRSYNLKIVEIHHATYLNG